jgi:spore germination protein Q
MNNSYYNPYTGNPSVPSTPQVASNVPSGVEEEQSYIENILRLNRGKLGRFYMSFPDSVEWRDKVFTGIIEQSGRDHIIISDPNTGKWYLLLIVYLSYVEFDEKINFIKKF